MRLPHGHVVLGDWDHVAVGPPEWDLAQPHYTCRRLGHPDPTDLDTLADVYGWDIRGWPGLDTLIAVREITGLAPYIAAPKPTRPPPPSSPTASTHSNAARPTARWRPPTRP
jgi:hypothetical protein